MCVYIYIYINIHSTHTYIMQIKTFILDAINRLTALNQILTPYNILQYYRLYCKPFKSSVMSHLIYNFLRQYSNLQITEHFYCWITHSFSIFCLPYIYKLSDLDFSVSGCNVTVAKSFWKHSKSSKVLQHNREIPESLIMLDLKSYLSSYSSFMRVDNIYR